eukprot:2688512-Pleurochrysis_carterae.AAC.1
MAPAALGPFHRPRLTGGRTRALWIAALHVARLHVAQDVASGRDGEVPIADAGRESESHVQQGGYVIAKATHGIGQLFGYH